MHLKYTKIISIENDRNYKQYTHPLGTMLYENSNRIEQAVSVEASQWENQVFEAPLIAESNEGSTKDAKEQNAKPRESSFFEGKISTKRINVEGPNFTKAVLGNTHVDKTSECEIIAGGSQKDNIITETRDFAVYLKEQRVHITKDSDDMSCSNQITGGLTSNVEECKQANESTMDKRRRLSVEDNNMNNSWRICLLLRRKTSNARRNENNGG